MPRNAALHEKSQGITSSSTTIKQTWRARVRAAEQGAAGLKRVGGGLTDGAKENSILLESLDDENSAN